MQPITTDLYLPALPGLAADLNSPMGSTQLTLSALLFAFGFSQLLLGPVADRFGRRPVLLGGLALFVLASIGSALAADIGALIAWRALQGVGMAAAVVCARAMVRDLYVPADGARVMSKALTGLGLIALASPLLGGAARQHRWAGATRWRRSACSAPSAWRWWRWRMPETARARNPRRAAPGADVRAVGAHPAPPHLHRLGAADRLHLRRPVRLPGRLVLRLHRRARQLAHGLRPVHRRLLGLLHRRHLLVPALAAAPRPGRRGEARRGLHAGRRAVDGRPGAGPA